MHVFPALVVTQCTSRRFSESRIGRLRLSSRKQALEFSASLSAESAHFLGDLAEGAGGDARDLAHSSVLESMEKTGVCVVVGLALLALRPLSCILCW